MLLASFILAASLGQACPAPPSRSGPPPCAAANVPGCLPGYHRQVDAYGHVTYVCDRVVPSAAVPPAPPPPAVVYAPAGPPTAWYPGRTGPRGTVGLELAPGGSTLDHGDTTHGTADIALLLRGPRGGGSLRIGYEYSDPVRLVDASLKYDFFPWSPVEPFLSVGAGGAWLKSDRLWHTTGSLSLGLDFWLTRDLFATAELKERAFFDSDLNPSDLHQTSFLAGLGFYF
ncbi:MAG TPA: hypothetical protein VLV17_02075 [Anaeromyxobacteraceae bacterium]|nr:hypothetical protein [Anaeromyxobacteraceae bacterium]